MAKTRANCPHCGHTLDLKKDSNLFEDSLKNSAIGTGVGMAVGGPLGAAIGAGVGGALTWMTGKALKCPRCGEKFKINSK